MSAWCGDEGCVGLGAAGDRLCARAVADVAGRRVSLSPRRVVLELIQPIPEAVDQVIEEIQHGRILLAADYLMDPRRSSFKGALWIGVLLAVGLCAAMALIGLMLAWL